MLGSVNGDQECIYLNRRVFLDLDIHGASWLTEKNEQFVRENRQVLVQGKESNSRLRIVGYWTVLKSP